LFENGNAFTRKNLKARMCGTENTKKKRIAKTRSRSASEDQDRRDCKKVSITLQPINEDFINNVILPNNPKLEGNRSAAINMCMDAVRLSHGYK